VPFFYENEIWTRFFFCCNPGLMVGIWLGFEAKAAIADAAVVSGTE